MFPPCFSWVGVVWSLYLSPHPGIVPSTSHRSSQLRAPGQRGVHYKVWGPLIGQMLLRSMDRANDLYDSMQLRGFDGEFRTGREEPLKAADFLWPLIWAAIIILLRLFPVAELVGALFV